MSKIKLKVIKDKDTPETYAQGEYKADLMHATVEAHPAFAEHLVAMGYAEYYKKDLDAIEAAAEVPEDAPVFVERESPHPAEFVTPAQPKAPSVPTEEITVAADKKRGKK